MSWSVGGAPRALVISGEGLGEGPLWMLAEPLGVAEEPAAFPVGEAGRALPGALSARGGAWHLHLLLAAQGGGGPAPHPPLSPDGEVFLTVMDGR